jgi:hypothetical protein
MWDIKVIHTRTLFAAKNVHFKWPLTWMCYDDFRADTSRTDRIDGRQCYPADQNTAFWVGNYVTHAPLARGELRDG